MEQEQAKKNLSECYSQAKEAYEKQDYITFLGRLRISMEWLAKVLIYEFAGENNGKDLLKKGKKDLYGIHIVDQGKRMESTVLLKAVPRVFQACSIKGNKCTIEKQVDTLISAYGVCSEVAMHAGNNQIDVKLQAKNLSSLLPAFVDVLISAGILKNKSIKDLLPNITHRNEEDVNIIGSLTSKIEKSEVQLQQLELEKQQLLNDRDKLTNEKNAQNNVLQQQVLDAKREAFEANRLRTEEKSLSMAEIEKYEKRIQELERKIQRPSSHSSEPNPTMANTPANSIYKEVESLDDDQLDLIDQNFSESMLVAGCAGSGKSVIAMHKARQIMESGASVILIAYTKSLRGFMNEGRNEPALSNHCMYYYQWKEEQHMPHADYIIVDEIQDFTKSEIQEFMAAAEKCFFFFGDTAQSIYNIPNRPTMSIEDISKLTGLDALTLYNNYRLPRPVAKITQDYVGVEVEKYKDRVYQSTSDSMPHIIGYSSEEEQLQALVNLLKSQTLNNIGILLPDNKEVVAVYEQLLEAGLSVECKYSLGTKYYDSLNFETDAPKIMTYHSAKGLQFQTVILPLCRSVHSIEEQKALYVAMTRTKKELYVLYSGADRPKPLDKVPEHLFSKKV